MKHNKKHSTPAPSKPWRKTLQIPAIPYPSEDQFQKQGTKTVSSPQRPSSLASSPEPREQNIASELAVIATNIWRTRKKMVDEKSGEPREEMRRVYHHIQAVLDTFHKMALEIRDHTGEAFDYGSPLAVITTQPTPGLKIGRAHV